MDGTAEHVAMKANQETIVALNIDKENVPKMNKFCS